MRIREARPEDAEGIDHVIKETWTDAYTGVEPEERLNEIRDMNEVTPHDELRDWIEADSTKYIVAEEEEEIIGEAILILEGDEEYTDYSTEAFFRSLYVLPEHQKRGIGTSLLQKAEDLIPEDRKRIKTMVLKENSTARTFYEKKGFNKCGETDFGGGDGSLLAEEHRTLILEKKL